MADLTKIKVDNVEYNIKDANALRDAPEDGKQYVRKDGEWSEAQTGGLNFNKTTVSLTVAGWAGSTTYNVAVSGMTSTAVVWIAPQSASIAEYANKGVYCSAQTSEYLTFSCTTTPTSALTVDILFTEVSA